MQTMMRKASIVLLLGLAALTSVARAAKTDNRFIVEPVALDTAQEKNSNLKKYWQDASKLVTRIKELVVAKKDLQKKDAELQEVAEKIKRASGIDADVTKFEGELTQIKTNIETAKTDLKNLEVDPQNKALVAERKAQIETLEASKTAKQKELDEAKKFQQEVKSNWTDKSDAAEEEKTSWGKQRKDRTAEQVKSQETVNKLEGGQYDDPADKTKPKLDDGGVAYWASQENAKLALVTPNVDIISAAGQTFGDASDKWDNVVEVEGFWDDQGKDKLIIKTTDKSMTLEQVQALFEQKVAEWEGKVETRKFATVTVAKEDQVPTVTLDTLLKFSGEHYASQDADAVDLKGHAARILGFTVGVESVTMKRQIRVPVTDDDGKPIKDKYKDAPKITKKVDGKDVEEDAKEDYTLEFLNLQAMNLNAYISHTRELAMLVARHDDAIKYDIVGNQLNMDAAPGGSNTKTAEAEKASSAWMIVAIIALVVLALVGLVYAYKAYTASGSLQNTDI